MQNKIMDVHNSFAGLAESLTGLNLAHIWRGHGSALFLELGNLTPQSRRDGTPGNPQGEVTIGIEWSWRIENDVAIICGSWSNEELWEVNFEQLRERCVKQLDLFGRLPEIELTLDGGYRLLSFSTTDGQPRWHVTDRRGASSRSFSTCDGTLQMES